MNLWNSYQVSYEHRQLRRRWADPLTVRHWHNPADPAQARRIEAAAAKRERRAEKLKRDLAAAVNNNWAHGIGKRHVHLSPVPDCSGRLNPFHVAK